MMPDNAKQQEQEHEQQQQEQQGVEYIRHENFESWYANNVILHPSEWDLKFVFGELDWRGDKVYMVQHTGITLAWLQAKLLYHLLGVQLGIYEATHGKIPVPSSLWPNMPAPPTGAVANDPLAQRVYEYLKSSRESFIESLKQETRA